MSMNRLRIGVCAVAVLAGCAKKDSEPKDSEVKQQAVSPEHLGAPEEAPAGAAAVTNDVPAPYDITGEATAAQGVAAAKAGAKALGGALKGRLISAMQEGGPDGALEACAAEASSITRSVSRDRLRIGRSSLRLRNQRNTDAPDWVTTWLTETGERKAEGVEGVEEVVDGTARVLMPIAAGGLCLACHGSSDSHSEQMKAVLAAKYPEDKATGYEIGDLRGALWAEFDLRP